MINFRRPAFQDVNNFCNKDFVYEAIVSVQSCTSQLRHWKHKNRLTTTVHINFILTGLFRIHLQQSFGHMLTCYTSVSFLYCVRYKEDFVKSRFCSIHFIVPLAGLKKIVRHTEDVVIQRFVKSRFHCTMRVMQVTIRDLQIQRRGRLRVRDLTLSFFPYSQNVDTSPVSFILPFLNRKVSTVIFSEGGYSFARSQNDNDF